MAPFRGGKEARLERTELSLGHRRRVPVSIGRATTRRWQTTRETRIGVVTQRRTGAVAINTVRHHRPGATRMQDEHAYPSFPWSGA